MHYKNIASDPIDFEFTSDKSLVTKQELEAILKRYGYFMPN